MANMRIEMTPRLFPRRGQEVAVGNVYSHPRTAFFRIVVAIIGSGLDLGTAPGRIPWNNVVCIHVDPSGNIVGSSNKPRRYVQDHQDLVGHVKGDMPVIKIEWFKDETNTVQKGTKAKKG